jgi:N-glycosidase YbiA
MAIKFYKTKDPYGFMGNYSRYRFYVYDRWWSCVEAPYQAMKTFDRAEQDAIQQAKTSNEARLLGQKVSFRSDWDQVKDSVMKECLMAKFLQHKDIRDQLMATGQEELIEDSPVDYYWGCGKDGSGKNMLGKLLMEVREELRDENA